MVINVKKTICAFRAVCPKTNMSKIVPQRYNKKNCHCQSTSIFVHFCQSTHKNYLEISKKIRIFAPLNNTTTIMEQHHLQESISPLKINLLLRALLAPRRKPSPGRDRREQPLELFEPLLTPPLCGQYKITLSSHFH